MTFLLPFVFIMFATCGFCIIFKVPVKHIVPCVIIGSLGWLIYQLSMYYDASPVLSCFTASCAVGLFSDICARLFKDASTIFIIPGILCLVPGSGMYHTMAAMLNHDMAEAASRGTETLLMAGAIAAGLLIIGSLIQVVRSLVKKTVNRIS